MNFLHVSLSRVCRMVFFLACAFLWLPASGQKKVKNIHQPDTSRSIMSVEASCGQCHFGLKGKGCQLAVRFGGKAYFVDGTSIDDYGDAHEEEGFCSAIRRAEVQGAVVRNRFAATYFRLLPVVRSEK